MAGPEGGDAAGAGLHPLEGAARGELRRRERLVGRGARLAHEDHRLAADATEELGARGVERGRALVRGQRLDGGDPGATGDPRLVDRRAGCDRRGARRGRGVVLAAAAASHREGEQGGRGEEDGRGRAKRHRTHEKMRGAPS
jgi:hypothetical protein